MVSRYYFKAGAFLAAGLIGLAGLWLSRFYLYADPLDYLAIAQNDLHTPWAANVNGYWSPLLPMLLAIGLKVAHPSPHGQVFVADGVLYATYLFVLLAYFFFHQRAQAYLRDRHPQDWPEEKSDILFLFGFPTITAAASASLYESIQPDLLVAGFFLLACGLLMSFRSPGPGAVRIALFAAVLALGYLSKAVFFPLALVFILCFYGVRRNRAGRIRDTAVLLALFLALSSVQWLPLSRLKGRLTFGDTGKINYVISVSLGGKTDFLTRQTSLDGAPLPHPARVVSTRPLIVAFDAPWPVTYPDTYDPSYWLEGLHFTFRPGRQLAVLAMNAGQVLSVLATSPKGGPGLSLSLIALLSVLLLAPRAKAPAPAWELLFPALAGFGAYFLTLILYRYVYGFLFVIEIAVFARALARFDPAGTRIARAVALALLVGTFAILFGQELGNLRVDIRHQTWAELTDDPQADAADALHGLGVPAGTPVAEIGPMEATAFPQLAGVRVVSRVEDSGSFWNAAEPERQRAYARLASTGAREIIARAPSLRDALEGWTAIGDSGFVLYRLR